MLETAIAQLALDRRSSAAPEDVASSILDEIEHSRWQLEPARRLSRLLALALDALDAEIGSILLVYADSRMRIAAACGLPEEVVHGTVMEVGESISGHVALCGEGLLVRNLESDDRFRRRNHERYHTPSCVSAPLLLNHAVRGVINASNKRDRSRFDRSELELLEWIGRGLIRVLDAVELGDWCAWGVRAGTPPSD